MSSLGLAKRKVGINGILNVNKPRGKTSYEVVAELKRLSSEKHIGHAGTLDPLATGVLPVCFGQSTKVVQFLMDFTKIYHAEVELGVTTDTYDSDGKVVSHGDISLVTRQRTEEILASFQGFVKQMPPAYSALRYRGRRSYELARAGILIEPKVRQVRIFSAKLVQWSPPLLAIEVECGRGTYIRSLVHELGQILGCGACVTNLVRLSYGPFHIAQAVSISEIKTAFGMNSLTHLLFPPDVVLLHWQALVVNEDQEVLIKNGRPFSLFRELAASPGCYRAYTGDGRFIAILRFDASTELWHPVKVFS